MSIQLETKQNTNFPRRETCRGIIDPNDIIKQYADTKPMVLSFKTAWGYAKSDKTACIILLGLLLSTPLIVDTADKFFNR